MGSGRIDKWFIMDIAKEQYEDLINLLKPVSEDIYSLFPKNLCEKVRNFEKCKSISYSKELTDTLQGEWYKIKVPYKLMPELERIAYKKENTNWYNEGRWNLNMGGKNV